ncbi:MAG: hypothetical protein WBB22_11335 [Anaerolineae bacterium]
MAEDNAVLYGAIALAIAIGRLSGSYSPGGMLTSHSIDTGL